MPTTERFRLNDLQQAVLDTLAEEMEHGFTSVYRDALAELIQAIPGHDDVTGVGLGPCLAALKRRGLVDHPVGDKRCRQVYITATGMEYAAAAANAEEEGEGEDEEALDDPGSYCVSCNASEFQPHREGCEYQPTAVAGRANDPMTRIDPETRRVVLSERDRQAAEQDEGEAAPAPGHDFKRCRHCQVQFKRPDEAPIPDDRCERCHEEIENSEAFAETMTKATGLSGWGPSDAQPGEALADGMHYPPGAENLQQGSATDRVEDESELRKAWITSLHEQELKSLQRRYVDPLVDSKDPDPTSPAVTTLQVAIHPTGTTHLHERTILLGIDDEGAGPYLTLAGSNGPIEIDDLATLDAIRREGTRLLRQAHAEETA